MRPVGAPAGEERTIPPPATANPDVGRAASFAPTVAALAAIAAHRLLPNRQFPPPTRFYDVLLIVLLVGAVGFAAARSLRGRFGSWTRRRAPLFAGVIGWLAVWELVTLKAAWMPMPYFPSPEHVLAALWEDRGELAKSTLHSLKLLVSGYAVGVAAGLVCGVLIGWFLSIRYWGMPLLKFVGPIPATAYVPLMMALFPNGFLSGSALIALAVWFPVTMLTTSGMANVPVAYLEVARTLGAGRGYLIFRVALPSALPSVFLGLFMGLGAAFLTLIVAETTGVEAGLGWYLKWKQGFLEYSYVYAALLIMAVFFSGIMTALFAVRDRVLGWQKGVIRW